MFDSVGNGNNHGDVTRETDGDFFQGGVDAIDDARLI